MSRHIIGTLQGVLVFWAILGYETIEDSLHIDTHIWIFILIDAQSTAGVLAEEVDDARLRQLGQLAQNFARYQVEPARFRLQGYFYLFYHNYILDMNFSLSTMNLR